MVGRTFTGANAYAFGFNGKMNDNEVKGNGNQQDYGMRIYDNRLGKFLSVDPLSKRYPYLSPYAFAENDVIRCTDLDGLEKAPRNFNLTEEQKKTQAKIFTAGAIIVKTIAIAVTVVSQPELGIPWAVSDLSGAPVTPSPHAWTSVVTNAATIQQSAKISPSIEVANPVTNRLARVTPDVPVESLSLNSERAFVTNASELSGLNTSQEIAKKLTLVNKDGSLIKGPFKVTEFSTPQGIATPLASDIPGFTGHGRTAGGASEFTVPNQKISELKDVTQKTVK